MNAPYYKNNPIGSTRALARALNKPESYLRKLSKNASHMYRVARYGILIKEDGSQKVIYNPAYPLKSLQQTINERILCAVIFPFYINGGIRNRSYRNNCLLHTETHTVVKLDISTFFESIHTDEIRQLWQRFFHFPTPVAKLLTELTTFNGYLPRGAPTSSYLANLIFWDVEPQLANFLSENEITYSRYIDDVTLSAKRSLGNDGIADGISKVYGMFYQKHVSPNRVKQKIMHNNEAMQVHRINVNGKLPTIPKITRKGIEAGVHNLARDVKLYGFSNEIIARWTKLNGSIAWMGQFHPEQSKKLKRKIAETVLSSFETYDLTNLVFSKL
jgi:hypothetical protein